MPGRGDGCLLDVHTRPSADIHFFVWSTCCPNGRLVKEFYWLSLQIYEPSATITRSRFSTRGVVTATASDTPVDAALTETMSTMHTAMHAAQLTGNPDVDFARLMIPHHQGAIDMAKVELLFGTDARLRRLAQEIIVTQQSEIQVMQRILQEANE